MAAQVGANAQGFFAQMDKVAQDAKATARTVNNTKASMKVQANTAGLTTAEQESRRLAASVNAKRAVIKVDANTAAAKAKMQGLTKTLAMKPIMIPIAILSGILMRAVTQSETGKKVMESLDRTVLTIIEPLLQALLPAVVQLEQMIKPLTSAIEQAGNSFEAYLQGQGFRSPFQGESSTSYATRIGMASLFAGPTGGGMQAGVQQMLRAPSTPPRPPAPPPRAPVGPQTWAAAATAAAGGITNFATMMQGMQSQLAGGGFQAQIASMNTAMATAEADILRLMQINRDLFPVPVANAMNAALEAQLRNVRSQVQAQQEKLTAMNREVTIMNRLNSMRAQAEQLNAAALSPLEVFTNRMAELDRLMTAPGGAGLTQAGFNTAAAAAFTQLQASIGTGPSSGPAALSAQSIEAQQAINAAMRQNMQPDIQTQIRDAVRAAAIDAATTAARAADIAKGIDRLGVVGLARTR